MSQGNFCENINARFMEKSSSLRMVEDEVFHGTIMDGDDNKIHTIPIVEYEERLLHAGASKCYTSLAIRFEGKMSDFIKLRSDMLFKTKTYLSCFGAKPFTSFNENSWSIFFETLKIMLEEAEQNEIYMYSGWSKDLSTCILGRFKIMLNDIIPIRSSLVKKDIFISDKGRNEICSCTNEIFRTLSSKPIVGYVLLIYNFLSYIKKRMISAKGIAPEFILELEGITGSYKTSTANAVFNPLGTATCSFEDTEAAIRRILKNTQTGTTIIDDYKCNNKLNNEKFERIVRMSGDVGTAAKIVSGDKVVGDNIGAMSVITGEIRPKLQQSSYARILFVDLNSNPIDKKQLSLLQNFQEEYVSFIAYFLQYIIAQEDFDETLTKNFIELRDELRTEDNFIGMHERYYGIYAWLSSIWRVYVDFLETYGVKEEYNFSQDLKAQLYAQHCKYDSDAVKLFKVGYVELQEANQLVIIDHKDINDLNFDAIDYGDRIFIKSSSVYEKICSYWKSNGIDFPCSERSLRNKLIEAEILEQVNGKSTTEKKTRTNRSYSGYYLLKNYFLKYGGENYEEF